MPVEWPKIFRDPVHDIISFEDNATDKLLFDLIDTKEFQRLRRIKQLGMADLVFPGATHTRFAHSVGAMHVARKVLDRIERSRGTALDEAERRVVLVGALLHDIGHGPFSHAFEKISNTNHEVWTTRIIANESTAIHRKLEEVDASLPEQVIDFVNGVPPLLSQVVRSQLDVDRFDYLLRDSHATGTDYGHFDLNWLIQHLFEDQTNSRFYLSRKAYRVATGYIFARHHMFQNVYYHKAVRSAEVMFRTLCQRYKDLIDDRHGAAKKKAVVSEVPSLILFIFSGREMTVQDYISLDDSTMVEFFKACASASDPILQFLGGGLVDRKLYKCIDIQPEHEEYSDEFTSDVTDWLKGEGRDRKYEWIPDRPKDTPYLYMPDESKPAQAIYIDSGSGQLREITAYENESPLKSLTKKYVFKRYYFKAEIRRKVKELANKYFNIGGSYHGELAGGKLPLAGRNNRRPSTRAG